MFEVSRLTQFCHHPAGRAFSSASKDFCATAVPIPRPTKTPAKTSCRRGESVMDREAKRNVERGGECTQGDTCCWRTGSPSIPEGESMEIVWGSREIRSPEDLGGANEAFLQKKDIGGVPCVGTKAEASGIMAIGTSCRLRSMANYRNNVRQINKDAAAADRS